MYTNHNNGTGLSRLGLILTLAHFQTQSNKVQENQTATFPDLPYCVSSENYFNSKNHLSSFIYKLLKTFQGG